MWENKNPLIIVHSHELDAHGEPWSEYRPRLDKALEFTRWQANLILTWGKATRWIDIRHCDAGKKYLENQWIDSSRIFIEKDPHGSVDTFWEAIWAFINHGNILRETSAIHLISSDYHEKRILEIQKFILWTENLTNKLSFVWVDKSIHWNNLRTPEQEVASLEAFKRTFEWVEAWNINSILDRMWSAHPLYKNHPSNPFRIVSK